MTTSVIYTADSPLPYTLTTGRDDNLDTVFNDRPGGIPRNSLRGTWNQQIDVGGSCFFSLSIAKRKEKATQLFSRVLTISPMVLIRRNLTKDFP